MVQNKDLASITFDDIDVYFVLNNIYNTFQNLADLDAQ